MESLASFLTHTLRKWNVPILAIVALLWVVVGCTCTLAQSGAGSIQGTVTDSTGAVIPGASIHVVNQATGVVNDTKSNQTGFFQVPSLFTGTYVVSISSNGMKTDTSTIELQVSQSAVINPVLTPGPVSEHILVTADTIQLVNADNGSIDSTLENARINQLPMNGREILTLVENTTPGLELSGQRPNGLSVDTMEYVQDGVPLGSRFYGSTTNINQATLPDPDAIQEVKIEESTANAQYAMPATGVLTTKSGTNGLHGSLFETARNNAIGIAKARQNPSNYSAPHLVRNEFGASVGGPVILPHVYHGKDKTFWFLAYERYSLASGAQENVVVPTQAMREGDFSGLINSAGSLQQLYDPATTASSTNCNGTGVANPYCRAPFANNQIPINRLSPSTKMLYDITPLPNSAADPLVLSNLQAPNVTEQRIPTIAVRLDHSFNENNKVFLRYGSITQQETALRNSPASAPATIAADGFPANASNVLSTPDAGNTGVLGYTHIFSPTFYSETVLSQEWYHYESVAAGNPSLDYEQMLGVPNNFGEAGFPTFTGPIMGYDGTFIKSALPQIITNLDENLSKTVGRHQIQFGGRYRHERLSDTPSQRQDGETFTNGTTALYNPATGTNYSATTNTGYAEGDFFLGSASIYGVNLQPPVWHVHDMTIAGYVQDDYHVSKNLTANIGLRWEAHPAPWEKYGVMDSFDLANHAYVTAAPTSTLVSEGYTTQAIINNLENIGVKFETPQQASFPSVLIKSYNLNFLPRLGLAYRPFGGRYGTVLRAGFGRYAFPVDVHGGMEFLATNLPFTEGYSQNYNLATQSPDGTANYLIRSQQPEVMGVSSANAVNTTTTTAIQPGVTIATVAQNYAPGAAEETNFTIEQPMKGNSALRVSYVWTHGQNLEHGDYYNARPSTYVWEMASGTTVPSTGLGVMLTDTYDTTTYGSGNYVMQKDGWSNDNALQANYQRLFHHGFAYQIFYVWSKPLRMGGNSTRDSLIYNVAGYVNGSGGLGTMTSPYGTVIQPSLPPAAPTGSAPYADWKSLNKWAAYQVDSAIPKQHITFNGIVDLPFGRGKRFLGNSNRFIDELVGGFQIAGDGNILSQDFNVASANWGPTNPLHVYKHSAPITDCRSGTCIKAYEWFNGYIAPKTVPLGTYYSNGNCTLTAGVTGLPSNWAPYQTPIDTDCNTNTASDPAAAYYNQNEVSVTLANGKSNAVAFSPNPNATNTSADNPFSKTYLNGPINYTVDLSVFKVFPITERMVLRFNVDAFNALNVQGYNNPNTTDGTENMTSSYNTPRQVQLSLRLTF